MLGINRTERKRIIDKNLGFWVNAKKQHRIADLLLDTPCTCPANPEECDRHWLIDHPDYNGGVLEKKMKDVYAIAKYLAADYTNFEVLKHRKSVLEAPPSGKYIILSDIHQGAFAWSFDQHDFFWQNKELYQHLLADYYYPQGYTLIEAGDIEEFWVKRWKKSFYDHWSYQVREFADLYAIRRKFHQAGRYIRLRGNHDNLWHFEERVKAYLWREARLDQLVVHEFVTIGEDFLLMHGHQVDRRNRDVDCKKGAFWTKLGTVLEFFTDAKLFGKKRPSDGWTVHPESNTIFSHKIGDDIYNQGRLNYSYGKLAQLLNVILINGHNHAPKCMPGGDHIFNSGCGVFEGIQYGVELNFDDEVIRVVDWSDENGMPEAPTMLCEKNLSEIRAKL